MTKNLCELWEDLLLTYRNAPEDISFEDLSALVVHLAECTSCQAFATHLNFLSGALHEEVYRDKPEGGWNTFYKKLMERIQEHNGEDLV